ncbi:MAG: hypothetical protein UW27_C0008G0024 [Parcubacteria group bacterium GW2011_GWA1_44_13]|uniref:Uncharacterized protein n=1 Tax=Candidatus Nomurabacteria bacterium GW2011_GWB1_44_12 TaxID=1618748 RepID=A0A837IBW3_9BACT|nr:MAG: hypothetical protein UW25_C0004G0213 [Candidatus Nomurabacteria bacterium GW2011_GWB1_44_12]KKT37889.1 MAG: hypothetical protein UW27_C0008G0024 [Parcubacteria group bacterium GW2011_GWA1_44_13]HBB44376.1 hypothetical protein [Candidatus Yonathbacteria bacterium]
MTKTSTGTKVAIGAGVAALAAFAAAGYFLYGSKDGAKNRKKVRGWMLKAKGEVLEGVEKMKDVSEEQYSAIIHKVGAKYKAIKSIDPAEVDAMMKELHGHWKNIKKSISPAPKKKATKKTVKKAK